MAAQTFSIAPTSAAGERSFIQRSRVYNKTRTRLSDDNADKTQEMIFNKRQSHFLMNGVHLQARRSTAEDTVVAVLGRCARQVPGGRDAAPGGDVVFESESGVEGGFNTGEDKLGDALGDDDATTAPSAQLLLARLSAQDEAQCE